MRKSFATQCSHPPEPCKSNHVPSHVMRLIANGNVPPPPPGMYPGTDALMEQRRLLEAAPKRPSWRVPSVKMSS